jgi:hypothetical protein
MLPGLMGTLLRYPYEVRDEKEYFDEIQDVKVTKDMLDLAKHIVTLKAADFEPEKFEDHYEEALEDHPWMRGAALSGYRSAVGAGSYVVPWAYRACIRNGR